MGEHEFKVQVVGWERGDDREFSFLGRGSRTTPEMEQQLDDEPPHFETAIAQIKSRELIEQIDKASMITSPSERRYAIEQIQLQLAKG